MKQPIAIIAVLGILAAFLLLSSQADVDEKTHLQELTDNQLDEQVDLTIANNNGMTENEALALAGIPSKSVSYEGKYAVKVKTAPPIRMDWVSCQASGGLDYSSKGRTTQRYRYGSKDSTIVYEDRCSENTLYEYYCTGSRFEIKAVSCEFGCDNGACIAKEAQQTAQPQAGNQSSCSDTDNGDTPYTRGTASSGPFSATDCCTASGSSQCAQNGAKLVENHCISGRMRQTSYTCSCANGACTSNITGFTLLPACTDTDNGINYNVRGQVVTGITGAYDCCLDSPAAGQCKNSAPYVAENYCSGDDAAQAYYRCPNGCQNGACLPSPTQPPSQARDYER